MIKSKYYVILVSIFALYGCQERQNINTFTDPNLIDQVGDIIPDTKIDGDFENCNIGLIPQYYAYHEKPFLKGKLHFENHIRTSYNTPENSKESGLLRIRFTVNCHGKSGRFRLLAMNDTYEEIRFSDTISDQLLQLTKDYEDWRALEYKGMHSDYYFYVTFKIKEGRIIEILP